MLGTNDAKNEIWNEEEFMKGYVSLVKTFDNLPNFPMVYLMIPPPAVKDRINPISDKTGENEFNI